MDILAHVSSLDQLRSGSLRIYSNRFYFLVAKSVKKGVEAAGADAYLIQVPETLSEEILTKMHAPDKDASIPTISHSGEGKNAISLESAFTDCDGIIFGYPTRFGGMPAQVKALLDSTGGLWMKGSLVGKPFSTFFSTGTQGSGYFRKRKSKLINKSFSLLVKKRRA